MHEGLEATSEVNALVEGVVAAVALRRGLAPADIICADQHQVVVRARQQVMVELFGLGFGVAAIGRLIGRDHTTVRHGLMKVLGDKYDEEIARRFANGRRSRSFPPIRVAS